MKRLVGRTVAGRSNQPRARAIETDVTLAVLVAAVFFLPSAARADSSAAASAAASWAEPRSSTSAAHVRTPLRLPASDTLVVPQPDQPSPDWQRQYDAAQGRKRSGRVWMLVGLGITGAGIAMIATETAVFEDCDVILCTVDYRVPALVTASGASALAWGIIQRQDAGRTIRDLETQRRLQTPTQAALSLKRGTALGLGPRAASLIHSVSW